MFPVQNYITFLDVKNHVHSIIVKLPH